VLDGNRHHCAAQNDCHLSAIQNDHPNGYLDGNPSARQDDHRNGYQDDRRHHQS
jgi:hypothetical protein